jgi:probable F420-dependent oxidoreductase
MTDQQVEFALALPNYRPGASREGIEAAVETCRRLGWRSVWTTDHILPEPSEASADYATNFEALSTLAYVGGLDDRIRLGTSVVVVPLRNAVVLAKEIATIDALTGGRLTIGVGVGWNRTEFGNVGVGDRFRRRGAYLDESIFLWRHLWSGEQGPFEGRFHRFEDVRFRPLPAQGAKLPIWVGGRSEPALRRAGRLGDGYQQSAASSAQLAVRAPVVLAAAEDASRLRPVLSARIRVAFGPHEGPAYLLAGTPEQMRIELRAFVAAGASHLLIDLQETDPERHTALFERFHREVSSDLAA